MRGGKKKKVKGKSKDNTAVFFFLLDVSHLRHKGTAGAVARQLIVTRRPGEFKVNCATAYVRNNSVVNECRRDDAT